MNFDDFGCEKVLFEEVGGLSREPADFLSRFIELKDRRRTSEAFMNIIENNDWWLEEGCFAKVFGHPDELFVVKFFQNSDLGYRSFLEYAIQHQDSRCLPKIYFWGEGLPFFGRRYNVVVTEKLYDMIEEESFDVLYEYMKLFAGGSSDIPRKNRFANHKDLKKEFDRMTAYFSEHNRKVLSEKSGKFITSDFSPTNFMMRMPNELVFTDPYTFINSHRSSMKYLRDMGNDIESFNTYHLRRKFLKLA